MEDKFYKTALALMLKDYENGKLKLSLKDAEELYGVFNIVTTIKNKRIEFKEEV